MTFDQKYTNKKIHEKIKKNTVNININIKKTDKSEKLCSKNLKTKIVETDNIFISRLKKILKFLIIILSLYLIVFFIFYCYREIKIYKLNKILNNDVSNVFSSLELNLKSIATDAIKLNQHNLSLAQTLNINEILKISANKINTDIIDKDNGFIIDDEYLGIYKYYNEYNRIEKKLNKKINIKNFFINVKEKLIEKKYSINELSINLINNIYDLIKNINFSTQS